MSCGPNEDTDKPVAVYLPVSMFEANSLDAYNPRFIREYVKVSIKLEIEHLASSQYQREAFSKEEVCNSKRFVTSVNKYQKRLEEIWKESRWIVKHISELRDKDRQANTLPVVSLVNWSRKGTEIRLGNPSKLPSLFCLNGLNKSETAYHKILQIVLVLEYFI